MSSGETPIEMEDNDTGGAPASKETNPSSDESNVQAPEQANESPGDDSAAAWKPAAQDEHSPSGYVAKGLDPVGKYAQKGLSPIGYGVGKTVQPVTDLVGGITRPVLGAVTGTREEKAEVLGGEKKAEDFQTKPILTKEKGEDGFGSKEQTAENPLGL